MTGPALIRLIRRIYGGHGALSRAAKALGRDTSTLRRWRAKGLVPFLAAEKLREIAREMHGK